VIDLDLRNTRSPDHENSKYMGALGTEKRAGTDTSTADGGEGTRPVFGPRRSLTIDVDDGGCIEAHGADRPSRRARHALDADGAGRNCPGHHARSPHVVGCRDSR